MEMRRRSPFLPAADRGDLEKDVCSVTYQLG